jgi:hypothetical protein
VEHEAIDGAGRPERPPSGRYYYLATTPVVGRDTKFIHSIHRELQPDRRCTGINVRLVSIISLAKPFDRLSLAQSYAAMLNHREDIAHDVCVVLGNRKAR